MPFTNLDEYTIRSHYASKDLAARILDALRQSGRTIRSYQDTAALDEFHMRGREASRELAQLAGLSKGMRVLDLGCGLGGPARLLAAEYGCNVTGIDLVPEFVQAAAMLTEMVGLSDMVRFREGNMLALPFEEACFDAAWSQHTLMNIADKRSLFRQVHRVLVSSGRLALYEVLTGSAAPRFYPVQWAGDASIDHLTDEHTLRTTLEAAGFLQVHWEDVSQSCRQWFESIQAKMGRRPKNASPPLGLNLVIGATTVEKAANTIRNLREDRIRVFYGVFRKASSGRWS